MKDRLLETYDLDQMTESLIHTQEEKEIITKCGIQGASFPEKILDQSWRNNIIRRPVYEIDAVTKIRVEKNSPSEAEYIALGYDPKIDSNVRHWRYCVKKELENCTEIMTRSPFSTFQLTRGLSASLFHAKKTDVSEMLDVGSFKGWINVRITEDIEREDDTLLKKIKEKISNSPEAEQVKLNPYIQLHSTFKLDNMFRDLERDIGLKSKVVVRLYIIEAFNLSSMDLTSPSDPYLYITLGDQVIDERNKHQDETENPKFYSKYEFKADLIATPLLNIKIYDYDYIGKDLIGETTIDLDDRFYSPFWRSLPEKPIEDRSLYSEETSTERGRLKLWVDIFKAGEEKPAWDILPQPDAV